MKYCNTLSDKYRNAQIRLNAALKRFELATSYLYSIIGCSSSERGLLIIIHEVTTFLLFVFRADQHGRLSRSHIRHLWREVKMLA